MYKQSLAAHNKLPPQHELPTRLLSILARNGFVEAEDGKRPQLKIKKLREAIMNGKIWEVRNVGKKYVMLLCKWLEEHKQAASIHPPEG